MKKRLTVILTVFLLAVVLSVGAFSVTVSAAAEGDYSYFIFDGEATITGVNTSISGDVVIPKTLDGCPVTSIVGSLFKDCKGLTSITIPDTVPSIGYRAFYGCENLKSITIPDSVTSIGWGAFEGCTSLTSITIPNNVTTIESDMFKGCKNLTSIAIPDNVTSIGYRAFYDCESLKSITIPDGVTSIGYGAFSGCGSLESITIPDGVTSIENDTFKNCGSLVRIVIPKGVVNVGISAFYGCENLKSITIPDGVTSIGSDAFSICTSLKSMIIPDSVTSIGGDAFSVCVSLESITISDRITSISNGMFSGCTSLRSVEIPEGVTSIGDSAFSGCKSMESLTIPEGVSSIGYYVFSGCNALKTVKIYNKSCAIKPECGLNVNQTIYGFRGSTAETFAAEIGAKFAEIVPEHPHAYSNQCDKTCNICGETRTVGAHKYTNACDTTCNYCSAKRSIKHTYTNSCDTSCNVCNASRNITHTYKTTTTQATLTQNGSILKKCSVCGHSTRSSVRYPKTFKLSATSYTYNGKVKTPTVTVTDTAGKTLKKDTDYTVTYASGRKNAGTYKVTVKMIGKYTGTKTLTFKINPRKLTSYKLSATTYTYNGKVKTPTVTVKNSSGTILTKDTHYTVTYASGRKNVGTYKVTVKGKGNYTGTKTLTFKINPRKLTSYKLSATTYTYNGKVKTPTVTVKNSSGTTLTKDTHYTVTYASGRKNVGTYKVTVKGKGNYTGTKTLTFKINPVKTTVSKLTAGKKSFTAVVTKKTAQVSGYQVQYSTSKSFSKATTKTLSGNTTTKCTLKSLSAGKTYYVRVRTYKTVNGTKYYSGWSDYKSVKTK